MSGHKHHQKNHAKAVPANVVSFVNLFYKDAKLVSVKSGIPVQVILAQSGLESGWGSKVIGNAYFGVKGKSPKGNSATFGTHENVGGKSIPVNGTFRAYANYAEAADDYASAIQKYFPAAMADAGDPDQFVKDLQKLGYATAPNYAAQLQKIMANFINPLLVNRK